MAALAGLQTGLLAGVVAPTLLSLPLRSTLGLWAMLWLGAMAATALGLLVSCAARTHRFAVTAVPLLLAPQLLLGSLLRSREDLGALGLVPAVLSDATAQRWAFEGALNFDTYAGGGVLRPALSKQREPRLVSLSEQSIVSTFFGEHSSGTASGARRRLWVPAACLAGQGGLLLAAAYATLCWRFSKKPRVRGKEVVR